LHRILMPTVATVRSDIVAARPTANTDLVLHWLILQVGPTSVLTLYMQCQCPPKKTTV